METKPETDAGFAAMLADALEILARECESRPTLLASTYCADPSALDDDDVLDDVRDALETAACARLAALGFGEEIVKQGGADYADGELNSWADA